MPSILKIVINTRIDGAKFNMAPFWSLGLTYLYFVTIFSFAESASVSGSSSITFTASHEEYNISLKSEEKESWTIFCYVGYKPSFLFLWINPVLKLKFNQRATPKKLVYIQKGSVSEVNAERNKSFRNPIPQMLQSFKTLFHVNQDTEIPFSAFNHSCIGVETDVSYSTKFFIKTIDPWLVASLASGVVLFLSAKEWSRDTKLHYGTGVTFGVLASFVILLFILQRLFPQSLRKLGFFLLMLGSSGSIYVMKVVVQYLLNPTMNVCGEYWQWFLGYVAVTGLISFGICYRYGPVTDTKTLNLIQWMLQAFALVLIYYGTQIRELSVALVIITLTFYNIPKGAFNNRFISRIRKKLFSPPIRLLTEEEYQHQGIVETRKALEELREFCRSPQCDAWKTISRLKNPSKFASFVEGTEWHITEQELLEYDSGPDPTLSEDSDEEGAEQDNPPGIFPVQSQENYENQENVNDVMDSTSDSDIQI